MEVWYYGNKGITRIKVENLNSCQTITPPLSLKRIDKLYCSNKDQNELQKNSSPLNKATQYLVNQGCLAMKCQFE